MEQEHSQSQTSKQAAAEKTTAETETVLVQIGVNTGPGQAMIGAQNKRLGVTDDDVQPMEKARTGIVGSMLMGGTFQRWDVTAITIAVDHTAIGKGSMGKFSYFGKGKADGPPQKGGEPSKIQEREGGIVTVYDIVSIPYQQIKWCIEFEISFNNL